MAMRGRPERRGWVGGKSTWAPRRSGEPSAAEIPASNGKLSARLSRMRSGTSMLNSPGSGEVSRLARLVDRPRTKRDKIMRLKRPFSLHRYRPGERAGLLWCRRHLVHADRESDRRDVPASLVTAAKAERADAPRSRS